MLPAWVAGGIALVLVAYVTVASLNAFVLQRTLDGLNASFALADRDLDGAPRRPRPRCGRAVRSPTWSGTRPAVRVDGS